MPWKTIRVKSNNQSSVDPNDVHVNVKSQVSVAEIAFGSTRSAMFFTLLSLVLVIISSIDLGLTLADTTLPSWDPKITGILGLISSMMISGSLMLMLYRKMNATVMPLNSN